MNPKISTNNQSKPDAAFARLSKELMSNRQVSRPKGKKGLGSSALRIYGKMFVLLSSKNEFVVNLPKVRVDELVTSGDGVRFDPRRNGKVMKEWLVTNSTSESKWLSLAKEAMDFALEKK